VLPWFKKLEGQEDRTSDWTGTDGPLPLTNAGRHEPNPTSQAFLHAHDGKPAASLARTGAIFAAVTHSARHAR
jgi:hypothetical protein